jgi:hypothetical protein
VASFTAIPSQLLDFWDSDLNPLCVIVGVFLAFLAASVFSSLFLASLSKDIEAKDNEVSTDSNANKYKVSRDSPAIENDASTADPQDRESYLAVGIYRGDKADIFLDEKEEPALYASMNDCYKYLNFFGVKVIPATDITLIPKIEESSENSPAVDEAVAYLIRERFSAPPASATGIYFVYEDASMGPYISPPEDPTAAKVRPLKSKLARSIERSFANLASMVSSSRTS